MANIDFPSSPTIGQQYTFRGVTYTFSAQSVWTPAASVQAQASSMPQGRLTLQSLTPVMVSPTTGATNLFYTPYVGNKIPTFDGSDLVMTPFAELTCATTDASHSPAVVGANKVNDWFVWKDTVAGVLRLSHGPDWTDLVTRSAAAALARVDGIYLNAVDIVNGPKAQRGTFVGTTISNASALLDWKLGSAILGGGAANLNVWNTYNRRDTFTQVGDTTSSWTPPPNVARAMNGSVGNRMTWVAGLAEDAVQASIWQPVHLIAATGTVLVGLGYDSITQQTGPSAWAYNTATTAGVVNIYPAALGFHFIQAMEWASPAGCSFYGNGYAVIAGATISSGLQFTAMM